MLGAATALALLSFVGSATAADCTTWADGNSDWNTASNWNPATIPDGTSTNVCITDGTSTVTLDISPAIANLKIGSGNSSG